MQLKLVSCIICVCSAVVAQLTFNQWALGSSPSRRTNRFIIGIRSLLMLVGYAIQGYANHPIIEDA